MPTCERWCHLRLQVTKLVLKVSSCPIKHNHINLEAVCVSVHLTEIRTSVSPSSVVWLNTTSELANYATKADANELTGQGYDGAAIVSEQVNDVAAFEDKDASSVEVLGKDVGEIDAFRITPPPLLFCCVDLRGDDRDRSLGLIGLTDIEPEAFEDFTFAPVAEFTSAQSHMEGKDKVVHLYEHGYVSEEHWVWHKQVYNMGTSIDLEMEELMRWRFLSQNYI
uniref:Uncharacterized protein n=1 Tax=Timema tahoe TaxID=61484 RepID=A0A7R9NWJ7_9NEOP|nr:unnamed protein product [Timema tahoe]